MENIRFNDAVVRGFARFSRTAAWVVVVLGLAMLLTWGTGVGPLSALVQSSISMHANAALACVLAGTALLLGARKPVSSLVLSLLVVLLAGIDLWGWLQEARQPDPNWLDRLLPAWPGRPGAGMTQLAALAFVLLGGVGALVVLKRVLWLRETAANVVIAISLASGATYGQVLAGDSVDLLRKLPVMTAALQLLLAFGWQASVPTTGLTRITVADSPGGAFARRLILPALLLPVAMTYFFTLVPGKLGISGSQALALAAVATGGAVAGMILWVAFLLDRGERQRRAVHALRRDAATDGLTGVANRRFFDETLAQSLQNGGGSALLLLDLDFFKSYNDAFGHQAGDDVLRSVGRLLRDEVRPRDLVARYGGEEFVILLPESDAVRAENVGQRILAGFRSHRWPLRPVTVSIGAAVTVPGDTPEKLLRRADQAMYRSKQAGRDCYTFGQATTSDALRASAEADSGEGGVDTWPQGGESL